MIVVDTVWRVPIDVQRSRHGRDKKSVDTESCRDCKGYTCARLENIFARSDGVDKRLANVVRRNVSVKINREKCSSIKYIWASGARVNAGIVIISGSFRSVTNLITSRHKGRVTGAPKHFRHKFSNASIPIGAIVCVVVVSMPDTHGGAKRSVPVSLRVSAVVRSKLKYYVHVLWTYNARP